MRTGTKIAAGVGGGVVATAVILGTVVGTQAAPEARVGTGYAAQASCVQHFINKTGSGPDLPDEPIANLLSTSFNVPEDKVQASVFGLYASEAFYTEGVGCTVAQERPEFKNEVPDIDERVRQVIEAKGIGHPEKPLANGEAQRAVDAAVKKAFEVDGTRGVVVVKDGNLISEEYAKDYKAYNAQLGWSMTKSVANVLMGRVEQLDPEFSVQDSALTGLDWVDTDSGIADGTADSTANSDGTAGSTTTSREKKATKADITYSDLLRMQSGLAWDETYDTTGDVARMLYTSSNMGKFVADKDLEHAPGTYREYSTGSTTLACAAMQEKSTVAQRAGVALAWETLFRPVGMASAMISPDAHGTLQCGSSAYATPRDWAKFGQFVMNNGVVNGRQLLPAGWMKASLTEHEVDEVQKNKDGSDPGHYGSGWWLNSATTGEAAFGSETDDAYSTNGSASESVSASAATTGSAGTSGRTQTDDRTYADLPADMFWADGHDGQFMVVVPSENLIVVRQGFSPGVGVSSSKTLDIVRAAITATH
ncbi:serine hydrolase [Corynebacterium sp. zg254]|uniref:Serine hydrolase n=1 Tax=Corynebacterium zhongnanshanii TaxID=2768834 RepID=A0ABQ6VBW8_9CORY|nr:MULTISPECIES: serine hydrolase [Corynebacterium]KAB3519253.1 serine hydrolase [Corynebacterium zhongnanshanii]MCR5915107.1 serine hydrolase [Corynebacterium sp. zg254]